MAMKPILDRSSYLRSLLASIFLIILIHAAESDDIAIKGGLLIDGYGGTPIANAVVLIKDDRIQAIGREDELKTPAGAKVIDANGKTILPGLINVHAHLSYLGHTIPEKYADKYVDIVMPISAKQLLSSGVTTARDPYVPLNDGITIKKKIDNNEIPGPRLFISGPALTGGLTADRENNYHRMVGDEKQARATVRSLAESGVDIIKILGGDRIGPGILEAIVDEAKLRKIRHVTSHALNLAEVRRALQANITCFEHLDMGTNPEYPQDLLNELKEKNLSIYWVPTLAAFYSPELNTVDPERLDRPELNRFMPLDLWAGLRKAAAIPSKDPWYQQTRRSLQFLPHKFDQLRKTGVTMLIGSDSGADHEFHVESTWREMWMWQKFGVEPMDIIQAATYWPARFLGLSDLGVIESGKTADVIVVNGNPLESMRDLRHIDVVIKEGKLYVLEGRLLESNTKN